MTLVSSVVTNKVKDAFCNVVEGEFMLVPSNSKDANLIKLPNGFQYELAIHYVDTMPHPVRWYKAVIISRTEQIDPGDKITDGKSIYKAPDIDGFIGLYKILAMPEQIHQSQLHTLVTGKLKVGDKVALEVVEKRWTDPECPIAVGGGMGYEVKLSPFITMHKTQERMFTLADIEAISKEAFQLGYATATGSSNHEEIKNPLILQYFTRWFKKKIQ